MFDLNKITINIKFLCSVNNITINKALRECGLNKDTYRNMVDGRIPSVDKIYILADYFNVSTDYILGRTDILDINR